MPKIADVSSADFGSTGTPGAFLRADRLAAGLSSAQLAAVLGISRPHLRNLERGGRPITRHTAELAARLLGTDPSRYLTREG